MKLVIACILLMLLVGCTGRIDKDADQSPINMDEMDQLVDDLDMQNFEADLAELDSIGAELESLE